MPCRCVSASAWRPDWDSAGATFFSKSIDDASSIGLGGVIVAQDAFNISADRSLSSFDQKHKFTGSWMYDLPFWRKSSPGVERHDFASFEGMAVEWQRDNWVGILFHSECSRRQRGYRPRGSAARSARISFPGQAISLSNPTSLEWFNTAAFLRADNLHYLRESGRVRIRRCRSFYYCRPGPILAQHGAQQDHPNSRIALTGFCEFRPTMFLTTCNSPA